MICEEAEQDLQIPSTVTSGGVKSLKPTLGQSHLMSNFVFGSWRWHFGFVLNAYPGRVIYLALGVQSAIAMHSVNAERMVLMAHLQAQEPSSAETFRATNSPIFADPHPFA
jgi:hypothetical protein